MLSWDMKNYEKSFEILDKYVPDATYKFKSGIVESDIRNSEIPYDSEDGEKLISLGWNTDENGFWCKILA